LINFDEYEANISKFQAVLFDVGLKVQARIHLAGHLTGVINVTL